MVKFEHEIDYLFTEKTKRKSRPGTPRSQTVHRIEPTNAPVWCSPLHLHNEGKTGNHCTQHFVLNIVRFLSFLFYSRSGSFYKFSLQIRKIFGRMTGSKPVTQTIELNIQFSRVPASLLLVATSGGSAKHCYHHPRTSGIL